MILTVFIVVFVLAVMLIYAIIRSSHKEEVFCFNEALQRLKAALITNDEVQARVSLIEMQDHYVSREDKEQYIYFSGVVAGKFNGEGR